MNDSPGRWYYWLILCISLIDSVLVLVNKQTHFLTSSSTIRNIYNTIWIMIWIFYFTLFIIFLVRKYLLKHLIPSFIFLIWNIILMHLVTNMNFINQESMRNKIYYTELFFFILIITYSTLMLMNKIRLDYYLDFKEPMKSGLFVMTIGIILYYVIFKIKISLLSNLYYELTILAFIFTFIAFNIGYVIGLLNKKGWPRDLYPEIKWSDYLKEKGINKIFYVSFALFIIPILLIILFCIYIVYTEFLIIIFISIIMIFFFIILRLIEIKRIYAASFLILPPLLIIIWIIPMLNMFSFIQESFGSGYWFKPSNLLVYIITPIIALGIGYWIFRLLKNISDNKKIIIAGVYFSSINAYIAAKISSYWSAYNYLLGTSLKGVSIEPLIIVNIYAVFILIFIAFNIPFLRKSKWLGLYIIPIIIYSILYYINYLKVLTYIH